MTQMQKAYETIRAHLIQQGKPAKQAFTGNCLYRTEDGLKCAVGCLISDDAYHAGLEDHTPVMENVMEALEKSGWTFTMHDFQCLKDMQDKHDMWIGSLKDVIYSIDQVARQHKLEVVK